MSALGSMMQRAGLLSESQVASAREYAQSRKLHLAEGILELNLTDEDGLVAFAASKLMIPRVSDKVLGRVEASISQRIPKALAWKYLAMPVSLDRQNNLTVAFVDPTAIAAVKEISEATGCYVVRAVAPHTALIEALTHTYGPDDGSAFDPAATQKVPPPAPAQAPAKPSRPSTPPPLPSAREPNAPAQSGPPPVRQTPAMGSPAGSTPPRRPPPISDSTLAAAEALPPAPPSRPAAPRPSPPPASRPGASSSGPRSWNPPLSGPNAEVVPLSAEALDIFLPKLQAAVDRDAVTSAVLDYLAAGFNRVILFVHSRGELRGHDARGADLLVDAVRLVRIPSGGRSGFAQAIEKQRPSFGPMGQSAIDRALSQALGGLEGNVLILPISLGSKTPLLVFAHGARNPVDPASIQTLSTETGTALLRLIQAARKG